MELDTEDAISDFKGSSSFFSSFLLNSSPDNKHTY